MNKVLSIVREAIDKRDPLLIGVVNAAKIVKMRQDKVLNQAVRSADMILPDGISVVWAGRLLGRGLPERVPGIDLMEQLLACGSKEHYRVYCLGATEEVLAAAVEQIHRRYPGVVIVGQHNGYFNAEQEAQIAQQIKAARPDILFVAMNSPRKEQFLARWARYTRVPACHGVGGAFDVLAGKVARAPQRWQRLGLEWLYRLCQEPRRMWRRYLITNMLFCYLVLSEFISGLRPSRR